MTAVIAAVLIGDERKSESMSDKLNRIYDVLVNICGAREDERQMFIHEFDHPNHTREWRFQGYLGFGGKYWSAGYVNCYQEDSTEERREIIRQANEALKIILKG